MTGRGSSERKRWGGKATAFVRVTVLGPSLSLTSSLSLPAAQAQCAGTCWPQVALPLVSVPSVLLYWQEGPVAGLGVLGSPLGCLGRSCQSPSPRTAAPLLPLAFSPGLGVLEAGTR